jgi:hypothetical protein
MAKYGDHVLLAGSERPARGDARLVGPADPKERLMVGVEVHRRCPTPQCSVPSVRATAQQLTAVRS